MPLSWAKNSLLSTYLMNTTLAHNLKNQGEIEGEVKCIIQSYQSKADKKLSSGEPLPGQLKSCIFKLCRFLDAVRVHLFKLEQQEDLDNYIGGQCRIAWPQCQMPSN
jgi:hypothetical protein